MISAIIPISNPITLNITASLSQYKAVRDAAVVSSNIVFDSFYILSKAQGGGITLENLSDLKKMLEENELTDNSAYELANTMIERFSNLSSDGNKITKEDLSTAIKFSVAQSFEITSKLENYMKNGKFVVSDDLIEQFGYENAQTYIIMRFLDSLSDKLVGNIADKMKTATARENADHRIYAEQETSIPSKITLPVDIKV